MTSSTPKYVETNPKINWVTSKQNYFKIGLSLLGGLGVIGIGYYYFYLQSQPSNNSNLSFLNKEFDHWNEKTKTDILDFDNEQIKAKFPLKEREQIGEKLKDHGNKLFRAKSYKEAIVFYSKAIDYNQNNYFYYSNRAACYTNIKEYDLAIKDSSKSVAIEKTFIKGYLRRASAYEKVDKITEAIQDYKEALKISKFNDKTALLGIQKLLEKKSASETEEVTQKWDPAIIRLPGYTNIRVFLDGFDYNNYYNIDDYDNEFPTLDQASKDSNKYEVFREAISKYREGKYEETFNALNEYVLSEEVPIEGEQNVEDEKRLALALELRGTFFMLAKKYDEAKQDFEKSKKMDPQFVIPYLKLSSLWMEVEKPDLALAELNLAMEASDESNKYQIHYYKGQVYMLTQKFNEAVLEYKKAIALNENYYLAYIQKGAVEFRMNSFQHADETYEELYSKFKTNPKVLNYYAEYLIAKQDASQTETIVETLTKSMELAPRFVLPIINLGVVTAHYKNDYNSAIETLNKALEIDPSCEVIYQTLAYIYTQQKDFQKATQMLDQSIQQASTKDDLLNRITHKNSVALEQELLSLYPQPQ